MIPLGKTRVIGAGEKKEEMGRVVQNDEEIALDEEEDGEQEVLRLGRRNSEDDGDGPQYIDTSRTPPADEDDGPRYIDTSEPPPVVEQEPEDPVAKAEALEMQRRIDAILQSIGSAPPPPSDDMDVPPSGASSHMRSPLLPPPRNLPNRPAGGFSADQADGSSGFAQSRSRGGSIAGGSRGARSEAGSDWAGSSRGGSSRGGGNHGRGGRNEKWWTDYYDPGFNTNPWESLEKEKGLSPVGTWLEYSKGQGRGGQRA